MFKKVLIANRGEVAVRIIRACRELGIQTVAVYSEVDKEALHTKLADEAVCIGPGSSVKSYLNIKNIIEAACLTDVCAIHPGYGFLSENSKFAKICEETDIKFIGPNYQLIDLMGNKSNAKKMMKEAGVPLIPGSDGKVDSLEEAIKIASIIGYPIMLKASSGGGGRGIRLCKKEDELKEYYPIVKAEAKGAFGDDSLYLEKCIQNPKHIEVQILADEKGNVIHLGERNCSIQRKNQKVIEEAPCIELSDEKRKELGDCAVQAAKAIGYTNAGTIEFLVDHEQNFYFMEMNTRLQVEHPITENITDVDIVKEQLRIASGEAISYRQEDIQIEGHSIECRINAENPEKKFMPCPGKIEKLHFPGGNGIRIDSGVYHGYTIPSNYDSMIAKLIVKGKDREEAIHKMKRALEEFEIIGIQTNREFLLDILKDPIYQQGKFDTSFIENYQKRKE